MLTLTVLTFAPAIFLHGHPTHRVRTSHRHLIAWLLLVLGLVLIGLAINSWRLGRKGGGEDVPRWYARLRKVGPKTSFVTGLVLPSFPAAIAAGTAVFHSNQGFVAQLIVIGVFLAVSSWNVITPTAVLYARPSAAPRLARLNDWAFLRRHNITFVVLGAIGAFLVARSIWRLARGL